MSLKTLSDATSPAPKDKRDTGGWVALVIFVISVVVGIVVSLLPPGDDDLDPDPVLCGELGATCATGDCCTTGLMCRSGLCQHPGIVTKKLALYVDPSVAASYPGLGTTLFDLSGNQQNCTLQGGASVTNSVVALDGDRQYISTTYLPTLDGAYTFELWFWDDVSGISHNAGTALISNYGGSKTVPLASVEISSTGFLSASERNTAGLHVAVAGPFIVTGQWVHVVASATTTLLTLYVNGVEFDSVERPGGSVTSTHALVIGGNHLGRYQTCRLGPVRVYHDKALTSAEGAQNYSAEKNMSHLVHSG